MKQSMNGYIIEILQPLSCRDTGKFEAPLPSWKHASIPLDDTYELCVVTKGTLYLKYGGTAYSIHEGQYLLMEPNEPPNNMREGYNNCKCDFYWLHFFPPQKIRKTDIENVDFSFLEMTNEVFIPKQGTLIYPEKVAIYMRQLQDAIRSNYSFLTINYLTTIILCEICNQACFEKAFKDTQFQSNIGIYNSVVDFINENIDKEIKLKTIAQKFNYNEQYISRLFKNYSKIPLHQYIINRKIEQANYYLSETSLSINEISHKLGYIDSHNFMKLYKRETGITPSKYRNSFSNSLRYDN